MNSQAGSAFSGSVLTVGSAETAEKLVVTATSGQKIGTAIVYVVDGSDGTVPTIPDIDGDVPQSIGIYVQPALLTLDREEMYTFTATGAAVESWKLEGSAVSTITGDGLLTVSPREAAEKIVVKASGADGKYGTEIVTVRGNEDILSEEAVEEGLSVGPQGESIARGLALAFHAEYTPDTPVTKDISWRVLGGSAGTEMIGSVLKVAAQETANYLTVRAEAQAQNSMSIVYGKAVVELVDADAPDHPITDKGITVEPGSVTLMQRRTKQFTVTESGTGSLVWIVDGQSGAGTTIDENGLLTAGSDEPVGTLTVWAISTTGAYGTAQVTVTEYDADSEVNIDSRKTVTVTGLLKVTDANTYDWVNGAAYGEGVFVIGGKDGKIFRSTTGGDTWTTANVNGSGFDSSTTITGMAYGLDTDGDGIFLAGGKDKIAYSTDLGVSWVNTNVNGISDIFSTDTIRRIRYLNGEFFVVGTNGKMAYSDDGMVWVGIDTNFETNTIWDITYGDGKYIASAEGTKLMSWSSGDADDWDWTSITNLDGVFAGTIPSIVYGEGKFVAGNGFGVSQTTGGNLGLGYYESDGNAGWTWTKTGSTGLGGSRGTKATGT